MDFKNTEKLFLETKSHRRDIQKILHFLSIKLEKIGDRHDYTKFRNPGNNELNSDFIKMIESNFENLQWYNEHIKQERHHLEKNIPEDVNLLDVIEYLADGIAAGLIRNKEYIKKELSPEVLQKAFKNTIDLILNEIILQIKI